MSHEDRPLETYYITKYALTTGVFPVQAYRVRKDKHRPNCKHEETENMISVPVAGQPTAYYHKPDWHETMEDALKRAKEILEKRRISLRKQLKKLEEHNFDAEGKLVRTGVLR